MAHKINLGTGPLLDLEDLLATRLLVQGSSGSGKTYLLRRLLEQSAAHVAQIVVDPEGEFVYLANLLGHTVIDAERYYADLPALATQARTLGVSAVLDMSGLEPAQQVAAVARFLPAVFEVGRESWSPCMVVIDEAHLFASGEMAGDKPDRLASASALANLMSRGRKRGLCGVIATQRVSKIQKNVVAEALNFLVGRTFLDIDLRRTTNLLGLRSTEAGRFRELSQGQFVGLGPALTLVPTTVTVGAVAPTAVSRPGDRLAPLSVHVSVPESEALVVAAPPPRVVRLPEPLLGLLRWLRAKTEVGMPWPGYLEVARTVPGVINVVHARSLVAMLVERGYLVLTEGARGTTLTNGPRGDEAV